MERKASRRLRLRVFGVWMSVLWATHATAQENLLVNSGFDEDLSGWEAAFGRPSVWTAEDAFGAPDSGAALLTHDEAIAGGALAILRQCHAIPGPGTYRISGYLRNLAGQPIPGNAAILVAPARNADCSGGLGNTTGPAPTTNTNWTYREWDFLISHATVPYEAILVSLAIGKSQAVITPRSAMFDGVELISLDLPDAIFSNGFDADD